MFNDKSGRISFPPVYACVFLHLVAPLMRLSTVGFLFFALIAFARAATDPASVVPAAAPRTLVLADRTAAFRAYCTAGEGAAAFAKIRADLDRKFLDLPFPPEPVTYGDPSPSKRTSNAADRWREAQDVCGRVSGVAEAATLCWIVTGEEKYLAKAKEFLLGACAWHFAPDWKSGAVVGATDIYYNDEAHFRLWRKLPLVYDQLRARLTPAERTTVLAHFKERGSRSLRWIEAQGKISEAARNSLDSDVSSHPVRFMAMTGQTALALWDDLPEAREWWRYAYVFYRDQFSPWGGDDGGWAEGSAYWRGTMEHAAFQDTLLSLGDPLAYASAFWKNSPYFEIYNVQPYRHSAFGDTPNAGKLNLEPATAEYFEHVARVEQNGFFRAYAALSSGDRARSAEKGLSALGREYPTAAEFLIRNFIASAKPLPAARSLSELPPDRFFRDVGWVSLHSALGQPADDIQITFKASPYGSFSHSHADQDAFILNAYGEGLAINSAYREYHNSPHHDQWTRQTKSKNALLIDGVGQKAKDKNADGKITRFEEGDRYVWTTGDATVAYQLAQSDRARVQRVTRDLVFVDRRYVVLRDRVVLSSPGKLSWLLHAEKKIDWLADPGMAVIVGNHASLQVQLVAPEVRWKTAITDQFPVPVDPKYSGADLEGDRPSRWPNHVHFTAESADAAKEFTVYAVLYPQRDTDHVGDHRSPANRIAATLTADGALEIARPGGRRDMVRISDTSIELK